MPLFAIMFLVNLGVSAFMSLLRPKPKLQAPKATSLAELNIPTATEVRPVPYSVGSTKIIAPNITWYGDLEATLISQFAKTSIFGTGQRVPLGHRYNLGWQAALAYGPQILRQIKYDDKKVWEGETNATKTVLRILQENLFGGEGQDGEGGINWIMNFYRGDDEQEIDTYIASQVDHESAHLGVSYVVSEGPSAGAIFGEPTEIDYNAGVWGILTQAEANQHKYISGRGYIGKIAQLRDLAFYIQRFPQIINPGKHKIGDDANPVEVLAEFWISKIFGAGRSSARLNSETWIAASNTLFAEDFGISMLQENSGSVDEIWDLIKEIIDCVIYENFETGLIDIKLIRDDYDIDSLRDINQSHIQGWLSYEKTNWEQTTNQLHFTHISREDDYTQVSDVVHDLANFEIVGLQEPAQADFPIIYRRDLAHRVALNRLRPLALPLSKGTVKLTREGAVYYPGDVARITYAPYGVYAKPFRVMKVDYGNMQDGSVILDVMEDKFAFSQGVYNILAGSGWTNPNLAPQVAQHIKVFEQPYFLHKSNENRVWSYVQRPNGVHRNYTTQASVDAGLSYVVIDPDVNFTPVGRLYADVPQLTPAYYGDGIELENVAALEQVISYSASENAQGGGWIYFEDTGEICDFEDVTFDTVTGRAKFWKIRRGILDTCPLEHLAGERVWIIGYASSKPSNNFATGLAVRLKHQTQTSQGVLDLATAVAYTQTIAQRSQRPLPPNYVTMGGEWEEELQETGDIELAWKTRNRLTQISVIGQSDADVTPEVGVTYEVEVYDTIGVLLNTYTGLTSPEFTYTNEMELTDSGKEDLEYLLTFKIYSKRAGLRSYVPFMRRVLRVDLETLEAYSGAVTAGGKVVTRSTDPEEIVIP